jgi:hypothetical protein
LTAFTGSSVAEGTGVDEGTGVLVDGMGVGVRLGLQEIKNNATAVTRARNAINLLLKVPLLSWNNRPTAWLLDAPSQTVGTPNLRIDAKRRNSFIVPLLMVRNGLERHSQ